MKKIIRLFESDVVNIVNDVLNESISHKYVNMNVEIRKGGRNAVKMSVDDFKNELKHTYHEYAMEQELKFVSDLHLTPTPNYFVYILCYKNDRNKKSKFASKLYNDIWETKYKFDSENVETRGGIKMSKKGFPYIQCYAGGDWESPVCFFVYFDGHHFRGYIPLKGNAINRNEGNAFSGSGNESDAKFVAKELNISKEEADDLCDNIDYNVDACLEDFLSRVEVKGTYKKRDFTKDEQKFVEYRNEKKKEEERDKQRKEQSRTYNEKDNDKGYDEINEVINNVISRYIKEATATGIGGLPGEYTAPAFIDDDTADRTPGDTCGMHDRVGTSNISEVKKKNKKKKLRKNDEGETVPELCDKCGGKVGIYIQGEPIFKCTECGKFFGVLPFPG